MVCKQVRNYVIKTQSKVELDKIENLMETEKWNTEEFQKYFHVWAKAGYGIFYFPKEKYFYSRDGVTNYAIALQQYGCRVVGLQDMTIQEEEKEEI